MDAQSALVVTANEGQRGKKVIALKSIMDAAIADLPFVTTCLVFRRTDAETAMTPLRDVWANEKAAQMRPYCPPEEMDSEDFLVMLYTSGSTGKPKGSGARHRWVFSVDVARREDRLRSARR